MERAFTVTASLAQSMLQDVLDAEALSLVLATKEQALYNYYFPGALPPLVRHHSLYLRQCHWRVQNSLQSNPAI
jgi:hypothetical protein